MKKHCLILSLLVSFQIGSIDLNTICPAAVQAKGVSKTIKVSTAEELLVALTSNSSNDILLTADIDCSTISASLTSKTTKLQSDQILDGQFYTISNLGGTLIVENEGLLKNLIIDSGSSAFEKMSPLVETNGKNGKISCIGYDGGGF